MTLSFLVTGAAAAAAARARFMRTRRTRTTAKAPIAARETIKPIATPIPVVVDMPGDTVTEAWKLEGEETEGKRHRDLVEVGTLIVMEIEVLKPHWLFTTPEMVNVLPESARTQRTLELRKHDALEEPPEHPVTVMVGQVSQLVE
jgi:hypothetical protein